MGAYLSDFVWNKTIHMGKCPCCDSDVIKIRQHRKAEEGQWMDGDLVECECCSHEGVIELHAPEGWPPGEGIARITWDSVEGVPE